MSKAPAAIRCVHADTKAGPDVIPPGHMGNARGTKICTTCGAWRVQGPGHWPWNKHRPLPLAQLVPVVLTR